LAQLSKMKGVPQAEIKVTGLDEYLKNTPKVTKQEVQDYLETNRLQLIEDERIAGAGRLTERDLNALPSEFDWLDRYDLDEDFEDKAHLRNHLMVTLNRHFDDLEADAADTGGFYARDSSGEVRYIPESRKSLNGWRASKIGSMMCFRSSQTSTRPPNTLMIIRSLAARTTARSFTSYRMTRLREVQIPAKSLRPRRQYLWLHPCNRPHH
jgi:hypothetical protein